MQANGETITMNIETAAGVKQHGFHLGTIPHIAERFVFEALRRDEQIANLEAELRLKLTDNRRRDVRHMLDDAKALRRAGR